MADFFLGRPIFAAVISILITLAGGLAVFTLPISQYPPVTPPTIQIDCAYPGASSRVVAETIAAPIEQRVNGVERMLYMSSQSTSDGTYTLTVTFEVGTDLNLAQVLVQNRVNLAMPELPEVVRATGITTRKRSPEILMTVSLNSPDGRYDQLYLSNYALTRLRDELQRLPGIADVTVFGQRDYSMRVWIDPERLDARGLTALDVVAAIREQNIAVSVGQVGSVGDSAGGTTRPITIVGRLAEPAQFGDITVKRDASGRLVRLKDVATVELGAKSQDVENRFDNKPTIGLAVFLLTDANALDTARQVKEAMARLSQDFPDGMIYEEGYDTTPFISASIREVFKALRDSIILVAIVVLIFLQNWRAALIPLATVPVAIVGTFAVMWAVGFGINNLTLFGLVLAVGIVVDDAIVVVEAVQHKIDAGHEPYEATRLAMREVSGPVVAVGVVLAAVFVPCAFLPGLVGSFFRQFALTIAISTLISTFNSLSLSPALAAILLPAKGAKPDVLTRLLNLLLGWFFRLFNAAFAVGGRGYVWAVGKLIRVPAVVCFVYGGLLVLTVLGYQRLPTGFIPSQDKGYLIASVQAPDAASAGRTRAMMQRITEIALATPGVRHVNAVAGNSFVLSAYGSNFGSMFIILTPFDERSGDPNLYSEKVAAELRKRIEREVYGAQVNIFGAPAVSGLGRAGGVKFQVEDVADAGPVVLQGQTDNMIEQTARMTDPASGKPYFVGLFTVFRNTTPQLFVKVDPAACATQGVQVTDVYATMQATLGARYVNDFNKFGRTWQVNVQADPRFRNDPADVKKLKVRNAAGQLVPLGSLAEVTPTAGPPVLSRYNTRLSAAITGNVTQGVSTGDAIAAFERSADDNLRRGFQYEWTELTFLEKRSRQQGWQVFALAVLVVFLVLAALYESWGLPLAVILVVPMCVSCALVGIWLAAQDVNVFTQVGFVVLIGLACKNAILIVEFAKVERDNGATRRDAILNACRLRLRPILMTSVAFILGVLPLVLATGAGSEMRKALGTTVFAGMLGVTLFGLILTPVFFVAVDRVGEGKLLQTRTVRDVSRLVLFVVGFGWLRWAIKKIPASGPRQRAVGG